MRDDARPQSEPDVLGWGEALVDAGARIGAELGSDAAQQFDLELGKFQRRRCLFYALAVVVLLTPSFLNDLWSALSASPPGLNDYLDPICDATLMLIYASFAVAFARMQSQRKRVMRTFRWLFSVAGVGVVLYVHYLAYFTPMLHDDGPIESWTEPFVAGGTSIVATLLLHFIASLFVALSPRDAIIPLIPITIVYCILMWFMSDAPAWFRLTMMAVWPVAGAPGMLWSTWRHRRFVDRFRWQTLGGRYRDLRADLRDARRVHDSLLPAQINDGPVRMAYEFEPMRDIGGDYLFAHRRGDGGLLVVIVDVSGHGIAAALAANRLHGELERIFFDDANTSGRDALAVLNRFVHRALAPQAMFASAIAIDMPPRGPITYANAGHPSAIVRRLDGSTIELASTTTLLGVLEPSIFTSDETTVDFSSDECVVACTDGVTEAADANSNFFAFERFRAIVASSAVGGPDRVPPAMLEEVQRFRAGEAADDVLVVALWRAATT